MGKYDFNSVIDRSHSDAIKYCELNKWFDADNLLPMWIADMDFCVCPEITEALQHRISHRIYGYASTPGEFFPTIADWLKRRHGFDTTPEEMTYIPGIVKGIGFVINRFCKPGDKIVIQPPVYHPFKRLVECNGCVVLNNPLLRHEDSYEMDLDGLEEIIRREHPRMMILCNPHNPGGIQWDADTLREVARLAKEYNVVVVSDEIHGDLMLFGERHIPFASVSPEAAEVSVTFGAPSKTFNIAGLAASWMMVPNPELRKPFYEWMEVNEFSTPSFPAFTAAEAAYNCGREWLDQCIAYIEGNIEATERYFAENIPSIHPIRPQSSFLVWLDCRKLNLPQDKLVDLFVNRARLALNDGTMFGRQAEGFMRLNVALPRKELLKALDSLKCALS